MIYLSVNWLIAVACDIAVNVPIIAAVADLKAQMFQFKNKVYE